jgi:EmrB/QacA subfamily drug resistance transporter
VLAHAYSVVAAPPGLNRRPPGFPCGRVRSPYDRGMAAGADAGATAPRTARLALVAAILGSSIVFVDGTVVNVALPTIQRDLGGGLAAQQWVVDAYLLTLGSLILVGGSLGDLLGQVRMFAVGVAGFGLASAICSAAPDPTTLIVCRGLQGVTGALLTPASLAVITTLFAGAERGAAIGTWTAWSGISTVAGPLLGGWLIGVWTWRAIFLINVPVAAATLAIVVLALPRDAPRSRVPIDYAGAALCAAGLGAVVFAFIEQPRLGWSAAVAGALAGGAAALAAFVLREARIAHPMLPLRLFRRRNFTVTNVETLAVYGGLSTWGFFLALFLQQLAGYSPFRAGLATLPVTVVLFLLSRRSGRLAGRYGPRAFMAAGPLLAGASTLALVRLPTHVDYWTDLLPPLLGFALGLTLTVAPLTTTVLSDAGPRDAGVASGVNNAVARVAGLVAIAVVGLAAAGGADGLTAHGFHLAMLATGLLIAAGGAIGAVGIRN